MNKLDFKTFAKKVNENYNRIVQMPHVLFANVNGYSLWELYLSSFPAGTNEIFRVRPYHDGSYDRSFITRTGAVVGIDKEGLVHTLWDIDKNAVDEPYWIVANALRDRILSAGLRSFYYVDDKSIGHETTYEKTEDDKLITWNHFHCEIPASVRQLTDIKKEAETTVAMYKRAKEEFTDDVLDTVMSLITDSNLYRGTEYLGIIDQFRRLVRNDDGSDVYKFTKVVGSPASRIRNTAIGTLCTDIVDGLDIQTAVFRFESKMDPTNYKRPRSVITSSMKKNALKTIEKLGIADALQRRHASLSDIPVTEVLWVNGEAAGKMKGGTEAIGALLDTKIDVSNKKVEPISFEYFCEKILPTCKNIELCVGNSHANNLFSLVAPQSADAQNITKWGNNFTWSYRGEVTDSIVERVKAAGGSVTGKLRVSLAWSNRDDLDLHCITPNGKHIYYGSRNGVLDVDMHNGEPYSDNPVENMNFEILMDGVYRFVVNNYCKRDTNNAGFRLQIAHAGGCMDLSYPDNHVSRISDIDDGQQTGVQITVKQGAVTDIKPLKMTAGSAVQNLWGVNSNEFIPVDVITNSPNYWDGYEVGNKHVFFVLKGCKNEEPVRGFYNEFLRNDLDKHRKVFEVLGSMMLVDPSDRQVSGFGFSSTRKDEVTVRVNNGISTRIYKLQF